MQHAGTAILGTGFMSWVHVEALRRAGVPVIGILGSTVAKSRESAERLDLPNAYVSLNEVLSDPQVSCVHVATPNRSHFEMTRAVLESGRHVLCEKPLAMTSSESSRLLKLARHSPGQAAGVNYNIRFYPLCLEARERVRSGSVGDVFHVSGSYVQDWLLWPTDYNWRVRADEGGELRAVADIGTHWLDLVQSVTGLEIAAVCADLRTVHPVRQRPGGEVETFSGARPTSVGAGAEAAPGTAEGHHDTAAAAGDRLAGMVLTEPVAVTTDDYGAILLRFRGGARGCLQVSQVTAGRKNCLRFEIAGSKQALAWNSELPNELWIGHRDQPNQILPRDPALLSGDARRAAVYPGGHNEGYPDSFRQCFRSFYDYIAQGDFTQPVPFPTFADGHRETLLCEAVLSSHKTGRWVEVPPLSQGG